MTRASLLHILDHVSTISEAEIRELEQLAAAFPYCQTAHVLLAKAAHDQGSMLASQRLRRAATYATDRQLLRQLIEQPAAVLPSPEPAAAVGVAAAPQISEPAHVAPAPVLLAIELTDEELVTKEVTTEAAPASELAEAFAVELPEAAQPASAAPEAEVLPTELATSEPGGAPEEAEVPETASSSAEVELPAEAPAEPGEPAEVTPDVLITAEPELELLTPEAVPLATDEPSTLSLPDFAAELSEPESSAAAEVASPADDQLPEALLEADCGVESTAQDLIPEEKSEGEVPELTESSPEDDILPAVAPPIRPPVEAGTSRFEFGLSLPEPAEQIIYQLPSLDEEDLPAASEAAVGFRGDEHLGYALVGSSRLGYCLQLADELTSSLPTTEFFGPDALLQEQTPRYQPLPPPAPSPFDLINKFLRNQPRLRTPAVLPPSAEEQADLSVRSTQGVPDIASESLAKIMVRQGKIQKAIEIYERLMMRQPEKKAYFAEQIQQLKSTE